MKATLSFAVIVILLTVTCCTNQQKEREYAADARQEHSNTDSNMASATRLLPSFAVQDVNGRITNLEIFKGKKLFVNLWASWCPPCKREMPSIEKLYKSVDTNRVQFLLISLDDQFEMAKKYVASRKLNLPIYYPAENPPALFQVPGIPATFIFNESGELIKRIEGGENYDTREYKTLLN